jgi:hypothetical protein
LHLLLRIISAQLSFKNHASIICVDKYAHIYLNSHDREFFFSVITERKKKRKDEGGEGERERETERKRERKKNAIDKKIEQ